MERGLFLCDAARVRSGHGTSGSKLTDGSRKGCGMRTLHRNRNSRSSAAAITATDTFSLAPNILPPVG